MLQLKWMIIVTIVMFQIIVPNRIKATDGITVYLTAETHDLNDTANSLINLVNTELAKFDFNIQLVNNIELADVSIHLYVLEVSEGFSEPYLGLRTLQPETFDISPIIYTNFDSGLDYPYWIPEPQEFLIDTIVGVSLYTHLRCDLAMPYFESLLESENAGWGFQSFVFFYIGNCEILADNPDAALLAFDKALLGLGIDGGANIASPNSGVNLAWVMITYNRQDYSSPYNSLEILLDMIPSFTSGIRRAVILQHRAQLYALAFDYDSAIADMDAAIELAEANAADNELLAELYTLRGEIIFLIYEWDRVLDNFNTALELDPDYAPAYFQRGVLYYTMTERENALADFEQYLELAPDGQYAEQAQQYIDSIQLELDALGG